MSEDESDGLGTVSRFVSKPSVCDLEQQDSP